MSFWDIIYNNTSPLYEVSLRINDRKSHATTSVSRFESMSKGLKRVSMFCEKFGSTSKPQLDEYNNLLQDQDHFNHRMRQAFTSKTFTWNKYQHLRMIRFVLKLSHTKNCHLNNSNNSYIDLTFVFIEHLHLNFKFPSRKFIWELQFNRGTHLKTG